MRPAIGRIVYFYRHGAAGRLYATAAVITECLGESACNLALLNPDSVAFAREVPFSKEALAGCWSWPTPEEAPLPFNTEEG